MVVALSVRVDIVGVIVSLTIESSLATDWVEESWLWTYDLQTVPAG
jgi:hypothetical protein